MTVATEHRYRLHPQAAHRKVAGEVFVVTGDRAFHRLQTATAVELFAALADAPEGASADELVQRLLTTYEVSEATARADVALFLDTLVTRQLAVSTGPNAERATPTAPVEAPADSPRKVTP